MFRSFARNEQRQHLTHPMKLAAMVRRRKTGYGRAEDEFGLNEMDCRKRHDQPSERPLDTPKQFK